MARQKQTAAELLEIAEDTISDYSERDTMYDDLEPYYFLDREKDQDKTSEQEAIEVVHLPYGTNTVDLIQDLLSKAEFTINVPALSEGKRDKALADTAEQFLSATYEQSARTQRQDLLSRAAWIVAMRGAIAGRVMAIPERLTKTADGYEAGQRIPLLLQLRDPRYVYPAFGLDGLSYVVERRTRTVRDIRNSLGDKMLPDMTVTDELEWTEYWDKNRYCYWADGKAISKGKGRGRVGPWPCLYGGIPYSYEFSRQTAKTEPDERVRPLLEGLRGIIDRMELLDSGEATALMQYMGDALAVFSRDDVDVDLRSGAINQFDPEDRIEWIRGSRRPPELETAYNKYSAQLERGTFPAAMYGVDPGRTMAGYAINLLNQSGQVRLSPILGCIQRFLSDLFENTLMVAEHYLTDLLGGPIPFYVTGEAEDEESGARYEARREQKLDARGFKGFYHVKVSLGELMPADEQANLVLATRARERGPDGRPLLSWETIIEKWNLASSPTDERDRIDREEAWNDPEVAILRRKLYAVMARRELEDQLLELDIDPDLVLEEARQQQQPPPRQPAPGLPGVPPQVQGQLMPQPMSAQMPGEEPFGPPPPPITGA